MSHFAFVALAYGVTAVTVAVLILWIVFDQIGRRADLAALEASGVRRRSDPKKDGAASER